MKLVNYFLETPSEGGKYDNRKMEGNVKDAAGTKCHFLWKERTDPEKEVPEIP